MSLFNTITRRGKGAPRDSQIEGPLGFDDMAGADGSGASALEEDHSSFGRSRGTAASSAPSTPASSSTYAPAYSAAPSSQPASHGGYGASHGTSTTEHADSSIISESTPSGISQDFRETRLPGDDAAAVPPPRGAVPLIGRLPLAQQQRIVGGLMLLGLIALALVTAYALTSTGKIGAQIAAGGEALTQSQRLAKAVSQAYGGQASALFGEVKESADLLSRNAYALKDGDVGMGVDAISGDEAKALSSVMSLVDRAKENSQIVVDQSQPILALGQALRGLNQQSQSISESVEALSTQRLNAGAGGAEMAAYGLLSALPQRIARTANSFVTPDGAGPDADKQLTRDLGTFAQVAQALVDGSAELRILANRDPGARERLSGLLRSFDDVRAQATLVLANLPQLNKAREAQAAILSDSDPLRDGLDSVQKRLTAAGGLGVPSIMGMVGSLLLILLSALALVRLSGRDQEMRAALADSQRMEAERQEQEAKRVNDANQAAILRLMNELQTVAEGDLTQQATVTEDITGAIADSVNYTVEELRTLVAQVQGTVGRVSNTTSQVETTSTELLAASTEQLREIRDTGESVLQMAGRINDVSAQAQQTATVARQSLQAAETGLLAVQNTIGGMNSIRDQIQETSKRIKRLGESSQEIGEITELISDITEQTNVLALNAAIQAASAGEAGRGFSVVAEEVQRLAERSGDATRQIAALVKTIQTDTQDAVAAMERSTQGVVEGTRLSDAAGTALGDIDRVSRQLAELIQKISAQASSEAESANVVAGNIQHIFAVTEQTGEGTRSTAQMVRELSKAANELAQSVARFKIG